jgi:enediyne biosynthesis protein E4
MSRYDADYGMLLVNQGKGAFTCQLPGLPLKEQVRKIRPYKGAKGNGYIVARNNDSALLIHITPSQKVALATHR